MVKLVDVGGGALALTHRPKLRDLPALRAAGASHVVTLLSASEQAEQLGKAVEEAGLAWVWVPMVGGGIPDEERTILLARELDSLRELIAGGARVVVHCSAGIHRTGMFGYALLRRIGLSSEEARGKLAALRDVTAEGVGEERMRWGDGLEKP